MFGIRNSIFFTLESSLLFNKGPKLVAFKGNLCHKFTSPRIYFIQAFLYYSLKLSRTCYLQNYVPRNQEKVGYRQTLIPTNKTSFRENYISYFTIPI